jgi:ABC-type antimicrobial peptide transport system permease subunit
LLSFAKRGLALTFAGLAIGLVLSAIAARLLTNLLYDFRPDYVPTATVAALILLTVAALASLAPARRASHVEPIIALRQQ